MRFERMIEDWKCIRTWNRTKTPYIAHLYYISHSIEKTPNVCQRLAAEYTILREQNIQFTISKYVLLSHGSHQLCVQLYQDDKNKKKTSGVYPHANVNIPRNTNQNHITSDLHPTTVMHDQLKHLNTSHGFNLNNSPL